jgi:hypothetical protein
VRRGQLTKALGCAVVGALLGSTTAPATATPSVDSTSTRTYFVRVTHSSGQFARARGKARVTVRNDAGEEPSPPVALGITPAACPPTRSGSGTRCIRLSGDLNGTATAKQTIPDMGAKYLIVATGHVHSLGLSTATGTARGPGFIAEGFCAVKLTLATPQGSVTLRGKSHAVPGFTSPL